MVVLSVIVLMRLNRVDLLLLPRPRIVIHVLRVVCSDVHLAVILSESVHLLITVIRRSLVLALRYIWRAVKGGIF